jgi:predicted 3-demethylubiquinone-9 3-methyltransferase (glyoxalase superfamily)
MIQKLTPNLWFDKEAEEAVNFYVSVFKQSKIIRKTYFTEEGFEKHKMPAGTVMTVEFELNNQQFVALNGGPVFKFSEAISFIINCSDQPEIDYYWEKLSEGGDPAAQECGWLKDKYGLSWQVVPTVLADMMVDEDEEKKKRVLHAMFQMKKLDVDALQLAFDGKALAL